MIRGRKLALRAELRRFGVKGYRVGAYLPMRNYRYRTADVVFLRRKVAVFVDGCFWHKCPEHYKPPASQQWRDKIETNTVRDYYTRKDLREEGWTVVEFWEHDIAADPTRCAEVVQHALEQASNTNDPIEAPNASSLRREPVRQTER